MKPFRSDILFLYNGKYYIPNGDSFTGEQRYDEVLGKILVSDVRIKRYFRDHVLDMLKLDSPKAKDLIIYVTEVTEEEIKTNDLKGTSAAARTALLRKLFPDIENIRELLCKCIDVRLFGGISTVKGDEEDSIHITGPVQFALLSPSMNKVTPRDHQNTSVFKSNLTKAQGAIGTTTLVPYSLNQIAGWVNPATAVDTNLSEEDVIFMIQGIWDGINNKNTRSKCNQSSVLAVKINYADSLTCKNENLDTLIQIIPVEGKKSEDIRSLEDFTFDFSRLTDAITSDLVASVNYRCTNPIVLKAFKEATTTVAEKMSAI